VTELAARAVHGPLLPAVAGGRGRRRAARTPDARLMACSIGPSTSGSRSRRRRRARIR